MSENVLELKNITMKFGGVTALNEVNLVVKKGEILALIGPNGAGKTTVFNVITGVYKPTSGDVVFQGKSILGIKRHKITKLGIARTFQNIRLFGESTALENVVTGTDDSPNKRIDRKSTRLNSSHSGESRMPSSA